MERGKDRFRSALRRHGGLRLPGTATMTVASTEGAPEARLGLVTSAVGTVAPAEGADVRARGLFYLQCIYGQGGDGYEREEGHAFSTGQGDSCVPWGWTNHSPYYQPSWRRPPGWPLTTPSTEKPRRLAQCLVRKACLISVVLSV